MSTRISYEHDNFVCLTLRLYNIMVQNHKSVYKFMMITFQTSFRIILSMYYYTIYYQSMF